MSKFIILLVVAIVAVSNIKADDNPAPEFPNFGLNPFGFISGFAQNPMELLDPDFIKNMKPAPGQEFNGASVSSSSSSETVNGVTKKSSSGRIVTNHNGEATDISF